MYQEVGDAHTSNISRAYRGKWFEVEKTLQSSVQGLSKWTGSHRLTDRLGKPANRLVPVTMGPLQSSL